LTLALLIFNIAFWLYIYSQPEKGCHESRLATVAVFTTENSCVPPPVDTTALQHLHQQQQQQLLLCSPRPTAPAVLLLGTFIGALYWHYILEKALLLRVLPLHSFLAARLKQHPPTHPPTHSNLVQWICGAASKQQQNGFSSSSI
jgi:hypothetical protein